MFAAVWGQEPGLCAMAETEHVTLSFTFVCQKINNKSIRSKVKNAPASICMDTDKGAVNMFDLTSLIQTTQKKSWETTEELSCTR